MTANPARPGQRVSLAVTGLGAPREVSVVAGNRAARAASARRTSTPGEEELTFRIPDGAPQGYAESYEKKNAVGSASGTLTAPFSGIHGWYWENPTDAEITVTLTAAGFYNMSHEFRKNEPPKTKMFQ